MLTHSNRTTKRVTRALLSALIGIGLLAASANAQYEGPAYPPPGGVTFSTTGTGEGDPGGLDFNFSNILALPFLELYWGASGSAVITLEMQNGAQVLAYDSAGSTLPVMARWVGAVGWDDPDTPDHVLTILNARFTMTQTSPSGQLTVAPAALGGIGAVVDVLVGGSSFTVNLRFEVEHPVGTWIPVNLLPQAPGTSVKTSFSGGFYWKPSAFAADVVDLGPGCGPVVLALTDPILGAPTTMSIVGGAPSSPALLYLGLPPAGPIIVPPCVIYMNLSQSVPLAFSTDASGSWLPPAFSVPNNPAFAGLNIRLQAFVANPMASSGKGFDVSNGLEATIGY